MQRLHSSLQEARNAALHLQESFNRLHEGHHFRPDYQRLLDSAKHLLQQIEEAQHHAPGSVAQALHKLHTANGCLAKALREERDSTSSLLSSIGSIGAPAHTDSFKNAERLLSEAMEELRNPGPIYSDPSLQPLPGQQSQQQPADSAPEQTGLLTQYTANVGSMLGSIGAMALGPGPAGSVGNLCVAVNYTSSAQLDLYVGCKEKQLRSQTLEKQQKYQGVKCITYNAATNTVWTGHADGSVKVHRIRQAATEAAEPECNVASDTCCPGVAVCSLVVEAQEGTGPPQPLRCWAGDAEGRVCVRKLVTLQNGQLHLLVNATVAPWENQPQPRPPKYLPVGAMLQLGPQMLVSGGCEREGAGPAHRLQLWDCRKMKPLKEFSSRCGQVTCLELLGDVLGLPLPSVALQQQQPAAGAALQPEASWRSSGSEGDLGSGSQGGGYRLLSGHADGQVVLWELMHRGSAAELRELAVIGEYSKDRVVKGICAFPQWDMLVVATSSSGMRNLGKLRVLHLPTPADLEGADRKLRQATATPHRIAQPTVDLQIYVHEAHTQKILATAHAGEILVTASSSSIRFWSPRQLALYAAKAGSGARPGLTFTRTDRISSGSVGSRRLSDAASLQEGIAARQGSDPSPFERTQQQLLQRPQVQPQGVQSPTQAARAGQHARAQPVDIPVGPPSVAVQPGSEGPVPPAAGSAPTAQGSFATGSYPGGSLPPGSYPSGSLPAGSYPGGSYPGPGGGFMSPVAPSSMPAAAAAAGSSQAVPHIPALFGPFGAAAAAAAGMGAAAAGAAAGTPPAAAGVQGWAAGALMSPAQGPMSSVPAPFGFSAPPITPATQGGLAPNQSPVPTRPLSPMEWQQQQQKQAMLQQQEAQQRQEQLKQQRELEQQQALQQLQQRLRPLTSSAVASQAATDRTGSDALPSAALPDTPPAGQKGAVPAAAPKGTTGSLDSLPSPKKSQAASKALLLPGEPSKQQQQQQDDTSLLKVQQQERIAELEHKDAADALATPQAEVAAHCGYQFVKQLGDQTMFRGSRALQVRCSRTNRLRTLLQIPNSKLQLLAGEDRLGLEDFCEQLAASSSLHHPHLLQVQEVFAGPLHLHIVLEECSAGRLLDYPAKQASAWGSVQGTGPAAGAAAGAAPAALSPDFARWFFQQVVLAAHYYHKHLGNSTDGGPALHHSRLSVMNVLLKIAATLPQPVVKVPTAVLARGISAVSVTGDSSSGSGSSAGPGRDSFIPPEAFLSGRSGGARQDTPAGDVWACGVLLLKLLGGQLKPATAGAGSSSSSQGAGADVFVFPAQQHSSSVDEGVRGLLRLMLQPRPQDRITLDKLLKHDWFVQGLPPTAPTMTDRFLKAASACKQSNEQLRAAALAAAAGPGAAMQLLQQVKQCRPRAQKQLGLQGEQQQVPLELLEGPVTPELQHGLQLQLHALRQACLQLHSSSQAGLQGSSTSTSASKLSELLAAQQAAADAVSTFTAMEGAARALQQLARLQQAKVSPLRQRGQQDRRLGMALLLQSSCTDALYQVSKLQQLLAGTSEPPLWHKLQHSVPARGKASTDGRPDPVAWERLVHLLVLQAYLLVQAFWVLRSLWVCRAAAAAVTRACMGRRCAAAHAAGRKPHLLTSVLGPSAPACLVATAAAATLQLQQTPSAALKQKQQRPFARLAALSALLLVQLNEAGHSQQQQWQRVRVPVQSVGCLEDISSVSVSKEPLPQPDQQQYGGCGSCTVYEGSLPQQGGQLVLVVVLSQLFTPDAGKVALPTRRRELREQRLQASFVASSTDKAIVCPICKGVMVDPVNARDGFAYCRACIERHIVDLQVQGRPVVSPMNRNPMPDTTLVHSQHLQCCVEDWRTVEAQNLKRVQADVQQQLKLQQYAWDCAAATQEFRAAEHLGLAHAAEAGSAEAARSLQQVLVRLQDARLLSGSNSGAAAAGKAASSSSTTSSSQVLPLLAPIHSVCSDPPLLVLPRPEGGTLETWIAAAADSVDGAPGAVGDFTLTWVQHMLWPVAVQLLLDVAAALSALHQQQPAVVHGGVHAAAVHLLQQLPGGGPAGQQLQQQQQFGAPGGARVGQLSLAGLLSQLASISSCHPFLAAPETLLASGPATPAADVYGLGVLMFQLATGWLPQQYTAGTDEQISAVLWCRDMMAQAGSTSPLAAAQALARQQGSGAFPPTGQWTPYGRHLPSVAALLQLPAGYVALMEQCLQRVVPARPCIQEVSTRLQQVAAALQGVVLEQLAPAGQSAMLEAMRVVEQAPPPASVQVAPAVPPHVSLQQGMCVESR